MTPDEIQNTAVAAGSAIGIVVAIIVTVKKWGAQIAAALGGGKKDDDAGPVVDAIKDLADHIDKSNETTRTGFKELQGELRDFKDEVHTDIGELKTEMAVGKQRLDTLEKQVGGK